MAINETVVSRQEITRITELDLSALDISDLEPIRDLTSLMFLDLDDTQVSALQPIKGLTSLQYFYLKSTQVSDEQVAALELALPKLKMHR